MWSFSRKKLEIPSPEEALPGRSDAMKVPARHFIKDTPLKPPFPEGLETAIFGMGCFWGAERLYHRRRLCRGLDPQSHIRGGVLGPNQSCRSGARGIRSQAHEL